MKNETKFEDFLAHLKPSNRMLDFYVDWEKCLAKRDEIAISLNFLNFLLGKSKSELKNAIETLFNKYPQAFECLNIIIAVRDKSDVLLGDNSTQLTLKSYFTSVDKICEFIDKSGLGAIFADRKIKDLNDFVFGIEVGLDTNARKNRSAMENLVEQIFTRANLNFKRQVNIADFPHLARKFGSDIKRFDFVVFGKKSYFIECNFYSSGGSKLNETARAYANLARKFEDLKDCEFVWITDGQGWFSAKNKLHEAYKSTEIYNLTNLANFIKKVQK